MHSIRRFCLAGILVLGLLALLTNHAEGQATFRGLEYLPGGQPWSTPFAVTPDGSIIAGSALGTSGKREISVWQRSGGVASLGYVPANLSGSFGGGISADGSVITGYNEFVSPGNAQAFRWTASGGMVNFGPPPVPPSNWSAAGRVSPDGNIVIGVSASAAGVEAFHWTAAGGIQGLGDLSGGVFESWAGDLTPDGSTIVGVSQSANGKEAYRWTSASGMVGMGDLAGGGFESFAQKITPDASVIVGGAWSAAGHEPFRWTQATGMVGLGNITGGTFWGWANDVSNDGSIIVGESNSQFGTGNGQDSDAFIWDSAHGVRNLKDVLVGDYGLGANLTGWRLRQAGAISGDGSTIVGWGDNPQGDTQAFVVTLPVPEPTTLILLGLGCIVAGTRRGTRQI